MNRKRLFASLAVVCLAIGSPGVNTLASPLTESGSRTVPAPRICKRTGNGTQRACFTRRGVAFSLGGPTLRSLHLAAFGRVGRLQRIAPVAPAAAGDRVYYRRSGLTEWWRAGKLHFEQGFTLPRSPGGRGPVALVLETGGHGSRAASLDYGRLAVTDATGARVPATLARRGRRLVIRIDDAHATYPLRVDPDVWLQQKATTSDGATGVAESGDTAVFAAPYASVGGLTQVGQVHIFQNSNGSWAPVQTLAADNGAAGDEFGYDVALDGDTLLVGAPYANLGAGAVYVFHRSGGTWTQTQELTASDAASNDNFGRAVAISGNNAIIGAPAEPAGGLPLAGAAYVFSDSGGTWTQTQKITASPAGFFADFGISVALDGTTALVGASGLSSYYGAAYVFDGSSGTWTQTATLEPSDGSVLEFFGYGVAVRNGTALVGAYYHSLGSSSHQGAAYLFSDSGGSWSQTKRLTASDGAAGDRFGIAVSLNSDGSEALVGAYYAGVDGKSNEGAAYLYRNDNGTWTQAQKFTPYDGIAGEQFGGSVVLASNEALIGAAGAANGNNPAGAGYFLGRSNLDLAIDAPANAQPNTSYTSQTMLTNASSAASPAVAVTVAIPAAASFISATSSQGSCQRSGDTVGCDFGPVAGNGGVASAQVTLKTLRASAGTTLSNRAYIAARATPPLTASASTRVARFPVDLAVTASGQADSVLTGDTVVYSAQVSNALGAQYGPATQVTLTDTLPAGATLVTTGGAASGCSQAQQTVTCDLGKLARGDSQQVTFTEKLTRAGQATNQFQVSALETDNDAGNNSASVTTTVSGRADLAVGPLDGAAFTTGSKGTVSSEVSNEGPDKAKDVMFTLTVGSAVELDGGSASQGDCSVVSGQNAVHCSIGDLAAGATATVQISGRGSHAGGTPATAQVTESTNDPDQGNDTATATLTVKSASSGGGGSNSSSGGGGGIGWPTLALLALLLGGLAATRRRSRETVTMSHTLRAALAGLTLLLLAAAPFAPAVRAATAAPRASRPAGVSSHRIHGLNRSAPAALVALAPQTHLSVLKRANKVGKHPANSRIRLTFGLRLNHRAALHRFLQAVQDSHSAQFHHFLSAREFTRRYGPTPAQVDRVERFLKAHGIAVLDVSPNRLLVHTEATTGQYEHALRIMINDYTLEGRRFYSTADAPRLPADIAPLVANVEGLDHGVLMQPHHIRRPLPGRAALAQGGSPHGATTPAPPPATTAYFNPHQIATAYDWPSITNNANGNGVTIAVVTAESAEIASDGSPGTFWSAYGLPDHSITVVPVDGGGTTQTNPLVETTLDVTYSGAMAPGANQLVYNGPNAYLSTFTDLYNQVVTDNNAAVMTTSWGSPETSGASEDQTDEAIFQQGAAEGISMFAAAGDNGSSDGTGQVNVADFPSSSKYVTAANGTELTISDVAGDYGSEQAWSGTGGAVSQLFSEPSWQTGPGVPSNGARNNSDMALNAGSLHPFVLYLAPQGGWYAVYGTSAVAPIFAGLFAVAVSEHGSRLGQSNKLLYNDVNGGNYASDFRDVTTGSNGAFEAGTNWDHPTGWGSPKATSLLAHIGFQGPHGTLSGTVVDSSSGQPVSGATVTVNPGGHSVETDSDGSYLLPLPVGTGYTATATAFGYSSDSATVSISDGQTTTQNFSLAPAPTAKVSGQVSDGSGHGYGLYGKVDVSTPNFGQVAEVWTNPADGSYSVQLPTGYDYTIKATAAFDGYTPTTASVSSLAAATTKDIALPVETACTAPGYTLPFSQDFNGASFPPSGWQASDNNGAGVVWELSSSEPYDTGNYTGGTGDAADADSNDAGATGPFDTSLITPPIPVSEVGSNAVLSYRANYQDYSSGDELDLGISTDGGSTWTTILSWTGNHGSLYSTPGVQVTQNLGPFLPASGTFQLRWHYYDHNGGYDWYAQIDDVSIGSCQPVAGGLVYGQVSDGNTGKGLVGASVGTDKGGTVDTITNPADPNLPVGWYEMFAPSGSRTLTASDARYADATAQLTMNNNAVVQQGFALQAGRLSEDPSQFTLSLPVGGQTRARLRLSNSGSVSASYDILPINAPPPGTGQPLGAGAPLESVSVPNRDLEAADLGWIHARARARARRSERYGTRASAPPAPANGPHAGAWSDVSGYPGQIADNAVAHDDDTGRVYSVDGFDGSSALASAFVYDPTTDEWSAIASTPQAREAPTLAYLDGKLYLANGWAAGTQTPVAALAIYDPGTGAWATGSANPHPAGGGSASAAMDGKMYVVGGCTDASCTSEQSTVAVYDPASDSWSTAADYPHAVAFAACGGIQGTLYCAGGITATGGQYSDGYAYNPATGQWSAIADVPLAGGVGGAASAVADDELLLAGGFSGNASITNQAEAYDPANDAWTPLPNANHATARGGGACGFYKVGGIAGFDLFGDPQMSSAAEVLPGYGDACGQAPSIPWLTLAPAQGTVNPGASTAVMLYVDGTGQQKFTTSQAYLKVRNSSPYGTKIVPLTINWTARPVNLVLKASASPGSVRTGQDLTYSLTVTNQAMDGHGSATQTLVTYPLPSGVHYVTSGGDGTCTATGGSPGTVSCDLGTLAQGESKTQTVVVDSDQAGPVQSTFSASSREADQPGDQSQATVETTVTGTADVSAAATGASLAVGTKGTLELSVSNAGPDLATGVTLDGQLGSQLLLLSATSNAGACSVDKTNNSVSCDVGQLASGDTATVTLSVFVAYTGTGTGTATVMARAATSGQDPDTSNNVATTSVKVVSAAGSGTSGNQSGGIGGLGAWTLAALLALAMWRARGLRPRRG